MYDDQGYVDLLDASQDLDHAKLQLESLFSASEALESLQSHLVKYDVTTEAHRASVLTSLEALTQSTGLSPYDLLPALEGHVEGTVSTESLGERLAAMWKRIVSAIMGLLEYFRRFFTKVGTYRGQIRLRAEMLMKKASAKRLTTSKKVSIEMGQEIRSFITNGKVLEDPDSIIRAYGTTIDLYRNFTNHWQPGMLAVGKDFERVLNSPGSGSSRLEETLTVFDKMPIGAVAMKMQAKLYRDPRFGRRFTLAAPAMLGGRTLFFLTLEKEQLGKRTSDPLSYAAALRTTGVKFAVHNVNVNSITQGSVLTASGQQCQTIAKRIIDVMDTMDAQDRAMNAKQIDTQVKAILKAAERYQKSSDGDASGYDESVLRFARNYSSWAFGPIDHMATNMLTVSRNLLTYANRSLDA